jgi:hypothetical protein
MGVPDSRGAVPTKGERRTDRLSIMNWLTKAPRKLGIGCGRCRTRHIQRKVARWCQPASWTGNTNPAFIPKNKAPNRAPDIRSLVSSCEIHRTTILVVAVPLVLIYNLESTHDLGERGVGTKGGEGGNRALKQPSTRSSCSGGHECTADTGEERFRVTW